MFYLEIASTFVIPLLTVFLMGTFTRVHRSSGLIGLLVGAGYGIMSLLAEPVAEYLGIAVLPAVMVDTYVAYPLSMLITALTMCAASWFVGWEGRGLVHKEHIEEGVWLRSSQLELHHLQKSETASGYVPAVFAIGVVVLGCVLSSMVFW